MISKLLEFFGSSSLEPLERRTLQAVADAFPPAIGTRIRSQVEGVNKVQRFSGGREVNLYWMRKGKIAFDDSLRFPSDGEFLLATVWIRSGGRENPSRVDVWMANGRVFSLVFEYPQPNEAEIVGVDVKHNPAESIPVGHALSDVSKLRAWLGPIAGNAHIGDAKEPPEPDSLTKSLRELDVNAPVDLRELYQLAGGFKLGQCSVADPRAFRTIVLEQAEFVVVAECQDGTALGLRRFEPSSTVYKLSPDDADPAPIAEEFKPALRALIAKVGANR
jgi:hypothetical protein